MDQVLQDRRNYFHNLSALYTSPLVFKNLHRVFETTLLIKGIKTTTLQKSFFQFHGKK